MNLDISFSLIGCLTKAKEPRLPYYLSQSKEPNLPYYLSKSKEPCLPYYLPKEPSLLYYLSQSKEPSLPYYSPQSKEHSLPNYLPQSKEPSLPYYLSKSKEPRLPYYLPKSKEPSLPYYLPQSKCYIITEWFFYINNFSLIIFYHSVWLGFELFGSSCRCTHIEYSSRLQAEDMTITDVMIKTLFRNETGVWMTSCPGAMGWEFGHFEKEVSWDSTLDQSSWGWLWKISETVGLSAIGTDSWSWSLTIEFCRSLPTDILGAPGCAARLLGQIVQSA